MKKVYNVVDMFCGAGGESTGIMQAAMEQDMKVNLLAINHWERAIETHATNHPSAEHLCESVERIDPTKAVRNGKLDLLWASPECTHHSVARGGRPRSDQSRASAWLILKWLSELYVERVIIENVPEFLSWGPLDSDGRPIKDCKGDIFRAFISSLQSFGYMVDWKILNAADYGDPTTRKRLFIQAVKGKKRILWPEITHLEKGYDKSNSWKSARDIIDWDIPGTSIFNRKKPLADATLRRIAAGIDKYWGDYAKPFLAVLYGSNDVRPLDMPLPSVTTSGAHHALVEPFLTQFHGGEGSEKRNYNISLPIPTLDISNRYGLVEPFILPNEGFFRGNQARSIHDPLNTVTSRGAGALVEPLLVEYYGNGGTVPTSEPIPTITTKDRFALLEPFVFSIGHASAKDRTRSIHEPLSTVVTKAEHCLVSPGTKLDIRFRMLKPHELARAQGFPDEYKILGTIAEQTKQIGNAVPVNTAKALVIAAMSE